jgi:hypothetical protein
VLEVSEARGWEPETSQARFLYAMTVGHWFEPLRDNVSHAKRAHEGLVQGGDLQNACFTYYSSIPQLLDCAPELEGYAAEIDGALAFAARTGNTQVRNSLSCYRDLVLQLRGETGCAESYTRGAEQELARLMAQGDNPTALSVFHTVRGICGALSGSAEDLDRHATGGLAAAAVAPCSGSS